MPLAFSSRPGVSAKDYIPCFPQTGHRLLTDTDLSVIEVILVTFNNLATMRYNVTLSIVTANNKKYRWNKPTTLSSMVIVAMPLSKMLHHTMLHVALFRQTGDKRHPCPINPYQHITIIKP